jgi:membrane protein
MANEGAAATRARTAPDPDAARKPDSPTDLPRPAWRYTLKSAVAEFQRDQCTDQAAALTYYSVLSVFPALLALLSLLGVFGRGRSTVDAMLGFLRDLGQTQVADQLQGPIEGMVGGRGAGFALVLGIATALFSASAYVGAFGRALNRIYGIDEGRPVWKLRPLMVLVTLGLVVLAALVLVGLVVSGPVADAVGSAIGLQEQTVTVWRVVKYPLILLVVMAMVAVLYHVTPNVRQPRFRWLSPGAVLAIVVWVVASVGFGFYVSTFGKYGEGSAYGSLGSIVVFLLWLWLTNLALLLGAELDAELERARELRAGVPAERSIQLPPRDTTQSDKAREKLEERVEEARRLREQAAAAGVGNGRGGYDTGAGGSGGRWRGSVAAPAELEPLPSERAQRAHQPH